MRYRFPYVGADLHCQSYSQAPANTATPQIRAGVSRNMPVYSCLLPQLSPGTHSSLTMDGQLMLSRPGCWFCTEVVHLSTQASPTCYRYTKPATKPSGTSVPSTSSFPALRWTVPCCATYVSTYGAAQLIDTTSFEDSNANALCNVSIAALTTDSTLAHRSINSADRSIPHDTYTCYRVHSSLP